MSKLFGLIGQKLSHSVSPRIHELIFEILGISASYHLFEVEEYRLETAIEGLKAIGAVGVNITIPYKIKIMDYIDRLSSEAAEIGSVNCIIFNENGTVGNNTDYMGFGMLLKKYGIEPAGVNATILGNGGVSKTATRYLLDNNAKDITVVTRGSTQKNIQCKYQSSERVCFINYAQLKESSLGGLIINCTPCGMFPNIDDSPVDATVLSNFHTAIDMIYNPIETKFIRQARNAGLKTANGLYMLVSQAVAAQEIWNDVKLSQSETDIIFEKIRLFMASSEM